MEAWPSGCLVAMVETILAKAVPQNVDAMWPEPVEWSNVRFNPMKHQLYYNPNVIGDLVAHTNFPGTQEEPAFGFHGSIKNWSF